MLKPEHREAIYRLALQQQYADLSDYLDSITVPEGWQVVPVELTEAMWSAGQSKFIKCADEYRGAPTINAAMAIAVAAGDNIYHAMLAAAPKPGDSNE